MQQKLKILFYLVLFIIPIFLISIPNSTSHARTEKLSISPFEFIHINGTTLSTLQYADKPFLVEWGASWCSTCKANLKVMNEFYSSYSDKVTFLSLSYGGSQDSLADIDTPGYKGSYVWDFGLDHTNVARSINVRNGYMTVFTKDLEIEETIVGLISYQKSSLRDSLNSAIQKSNLEPVDFEQINNAGSSAGGLPFVEIVLAFGLLSAGAIGFTIMKQKQNAGLKTHITSEQSNLKQKEQLSALKDVLSSEVKKTKSKTVSGSNQQKVRSTISPESKNSIKNKKIRRSRRR